MTQERIAELLSPFLGKVILSAIQLGKIETYTELLIKWNAHIKLTAIRDPEEIIRRHFGESLFAARQLLLANTTDQTAVDFGSGAGFPGLPLKIWCPDLSLTLVEAHQKKAIFLREVVRALGLSGVKVFADRAENLCERSNLVILRAVERFEDVLPIAAKLGATTGRMALLIGDGQIETARSVLPGLMWENPVPLPLSRSRSLLVGRLPA
jgi:16S rRNA (guanine527-N7)-methyltransferase